MSTIRANTILDAAGGTTATVNGYTPTASNMAGRNKIIGGDFTVNPWQRGTSSGDPGSDGWYLADRFQYYRQTSAALTSIFKTADAPTATEAGVFTQHCLHVDVTSADTVIDATDYSTITHKIEGFNSASFGFGQSGTRYVTLSFWHKHTKTGTYCVGFRNSAQNRSYVAEYTQAITDVWEKASITIPVDTSGTWLYDSGIGLIISFGIAAGANYKTTANTWIAGNYYATSNQVNALDSTANNFKIALVQLEEGSTATPFEHRHYGTELALCQRYFWYQSASPISYAHFGPGYATSSTIHQSMLRWNVTMRTQPTITTTAASTFLVDGAISSSASALSIIYITYSTARVSATTTGLTAGQAYALASQGAGAAAIYYSAEL